MSIKKMIRKFLGTGSYVGDMDILSRHNNLLEAHAKTQSQVKTILSRLAEAEKSIQREGNRRADADKLITDFLGLEKKTMPGTSTPKKDVLVKVSKKK